MRKNQFWSDESPDVRKHVAKAVGKLALRIIEHGQDEAGVWRAFNALLCASHLHPDLDEIPAHKIGQRMGDSKSLWSLRCVFWRDTLGLPGIGNGTAQARRNSAMAIHARKGTKPKGTERLAKALAKFEKEFRRSAHEISSMTPERKNELLDRLGVLDEIGKRIGANL